MATEYKLSYTGSEINEKLNKIDNAISYTEQDLTNEQKLQARKNIGVVDTVTPQSYGAKGDNKTDDTVAFQNALANNRVVFVPGGKYKISGELVIESNCQLEFAQDAVLYFTQTTGNCISMKMSANIVGNHATVSVPYTFSGNVINIDSGLNSSLKEIPPFTQWDPMWKTARFITDLNIVKPDTRGFYYSMDGTCNGTAVYLSADYEDVTPNIWATNLSKLRIAGAFTYGIFAESRKSGVTDSNGWIHQMRVDGFIDGAEVGLYLKNIEHAYASVLILPRRAYTTEGQYIPYAKWGICLENSIDTNLLGSRVMDWNSTYSLWEEGNMYQHIALLGNCRDVKLDDHYYHGYPTYDIRDLIYTDNPSNLAKVSILEEPITRWFKPKDGLPYFNNGDTEKQLLLKEEFNDCFITDYVPDFKDWLPFAIGKDGKIFNEIGYAKSGMRWEVYSGALTTNTEWYGCTGLIPIKAGDTLYVQAMSMGAGTDGVAGVVLFDASFNRVFSNTDKQLVVNESSYYFTYTATDDGFTLKVKQPATVAYAAFTFRRELIGDNPAIAVNEPLTYSQVGFLADSITVKPVNVYGLEEFINTEIEQAVINGDFKSGKGLFYIEGNSTTEGIWTGNHADITSYFDGLTIAYKINIAGVSGGTTLNINGLGAVAVKRNASTAVTTTYPVGAVVILTYSDGSWLTADYDANTKNTAGTSNKTGTKMYLVGATSQTSSGTTTYTNTNAYIGTDNCLYSGGKKVYTADDLTSIVNSVIAALPVYSGEVL